MSRMFSLMTEPRFALPSSLNVDGRTVRRNEISVHEGSKRAR